MATLSEHFSYNTPLYICELMFQIKQVQEQKFSLRSQLFASTVSFCMLFFTMFRILIIRFHKCLTILLPKYFCEWFPITIHQAVCPLTSGVVLVGVFASVTPLLHLHLVVQPDPSSCNLAHLHVLHPYHVSAGKDIEMTSHKLKGTSMLDSLHEHL